jgi:hypothetical protein
MTPADDESAVLENETAVEEKAKVDDGIVNEPAVDDALDDGIDAVDDAIAAVDDAGIICKNGPVTEEEGACAYELSPQHLTFPFVYNAQACHPPPLIWVNGPVTEEGA